MLGYVRTDIGELRVKHHRLYQATYCGLCHSIKKNASRALLPFLSYDFVFLAILRLLVSGEQIELEKQFCLLHPFKDKKKRVRDNASLRYASYAALFLTYEKMQDDLLDRDTSVFRRFLVSLWHPFLKRACRRAVRKHEDLLPLYDMIAAGMEEGRASEIQNASLDEMCNSFSRILSAIFSFGFEGKDARILSSVGAFLGRFIYTLDAADDLKQDEKNGSFNPILLQYGSAEKAAEHFEELDLVLSYYVNRIKLALDLLEGDENLYAICDNIVCHGLSRAAGSVLKPKMEKSE